MNGFVKKSYRLGEWLLILFQLQWYWLLYALKGCLFLGLFPATGTVFRYIYCKLDCQKEEITIKEFFQVYYRDHFKELNRLGYIFSLMLFILGLDLQVSKLFIHSYVLHYFLVALFILVLGAALSVFPIYSRYELSTVNYIKQGFYFFFTNILETIAMLIGFFLVVLVMTFLPILLIIGGIPLFSLPISWFAYQGMKKIELKKATSETC